jgi:hypothetical protein
MGRAKNILVPALGRAGKYLSSPPDDDTDKRFVHVALTDHGRRVLGRLAPVATDITKQMMASLTDDQAMALEESLRLLRQNAHSGLEQCVKRSQ